MTDTGGEGRSLTERLAIQKGYELKMTSEQLSGLREMENVTSRVEIEVGKAGRSGARLVVAVRQGHLGKVAAASFRVQDR